MFRHQWHHAHPQVESSAPLSWPLLANPIRYVWDGATARQVVLVGNPLVWWGFLAALPLLVYRVVRHRVWPEVVVLGGYVLLYGPWLVIPRTRFLFYMLPVVPFMGPGAGGGASVAARPELTEARGGRGCGRGAGGGGVRAVWLYLPGRSAGCGCSRSSPRSDVGTAVKIRAPAWAPRS
jgi:hypothetical protein